MIVELSATSRPADLKVRKTRKSSPKTAQNWARPSHGLSAQNLDLTGQSRSLHKIDTRTLPSLEVDTAASRKDFHTLPVGDTLAGTHGHRPNMAKTAKIGARIRKNAKQTSESQGKPTARGRWPKVPPNHGPEPGPRRACAILEPKNRFGAGFVALIGQGH